MRHLHALIQKRPELAVLLAFALVAAILLLVFKLGSEIAEGDTRAFDISFLTGLRRATEGTASWKSALEAIMMDLTALGDNATLVTVVAMVTGLLLLLGKRRLALILIVATSTGAIFTGILKAIFNRPRPDIVAHLTTFGSASFPSGHAMNSAVAYLTMAGLVAGVAPTQRVRIYVLSCAIALTFLIGTSRLYLGVHWPTDVIAGWLTGSCWAIFCWTIAWWFEVRARPIETNSV